MKIGMFSALYNDLPLEAMLDKVAVTGLEAVEIGCGLYPGVSHCDYETLLSGDAALRAYKDEFERRGLIISALSAHGNPLHPDPDIAQTSHKRWRAAVELAARLGVDTVNVFSGCPGDHENARYANWVTAAWPDDMQAILDWQWCEKVIPYWREESAFATGRGVGRIAMEMHPGMVVYNNATLLRLRQAVGSPVGANFDPSHLVWQQVDVLAALRQLLGEKAVFHFHAKDVAFDSDHLRVNGVLDTTRHERTAERSWLFRTVGYGHGASFWKAVVSELRRGGYRGVVSIEHEDALMSPDEGLAKAAAFLRDCAIRTR